jgi:acetyl esterase/lipase
MLSDEAKKSINKYKSYSGFISSMYKNPNVMSKRRRSFFRWFIDLQGTIGPKVEGTIKEEIELGGIKTLKVSTPKSDPTRILLYYHGGGYSMGSPKSHFSLVSYLADITQTTVFVPDYRLGPEHKYPAQLEDGVKTFEALIADYGYSADQISMGGDSAGGNLALITMLKLKEEGKELPNALALLSPWADPAGTGDTYNLEMADRDILLGPMIKRIWENNDHLYDGYLNEEDADNDNPLIFPIKGNYENSPPIMIQVGTEELLLSDSRTLKEALERDNCIHEYYEWEGMYHVFHIDVTMPETISAFKQIGKFLEKYSLSNDEIQTGSNLD